MGGLTAALTFAKKGFKQVDSYDSAPALGFVGAGIQIAPKLIRVLNSLGIWGDSALEKEATNVREVHIYDEPSNNELACVPMTDIRQKYGYSYYARHRASPASTIFEAAKAEPNVDFYFDQTLQSVKSFGLHKVSFIVKASDGVERTAETDVLVGADSIKSPVRESMLSSLNLSAEVEETSTAAHRILIDREKLTPHPELLELSDSDTVRRWIGPKRHIAHPIHSHSIGTARCQLFRSHQRNLDQQRRQECHV